MKSKLLTAIVAISIFTIFVGVFTLGPFFGLAILVLALATPFLT